MNDDPRRRKTTWRQSRGWPFLFRVQHRLGIHVGPIGEPGWYECPMCGEPFYDDGEYGR